MISVSDFISLMHNKSDCIFYVNDKITDIAELYDNPYTITGFEFEDKVVRLYIKSKYY